MQQRLFDNPKIAVEWNCVIEEIIGTDTPKAVTGLKLKNIKDDSTKEMKVDGVFIAIGHHPNTEVFKNHLELDSSGYIVTKPDSCETGIAGVFAAGDVKAPEFRQAVIAAGSGCTAALEAERWLNSQHS